jgi:stress response protein YsnF
MDTERLQAMTDTELRAQAHAAGVEDAETMRRDVLLAALARTDDAMTRSEQRLVAATEVYETGRARLRKYVVTEDVQITVQVRREQLRVEHEPIPEGSQAMVEDPDVFGTLEQFGGPDGGVIFEVTLHEERPVITTEIVPVERIRVTKLVETEQRIASGEISKERIEVDVPGHAPTTFG